MAQLDIGVIRVMHFLHDLAPENARLHDIGLFHGTDLVAPLARQLERGTCHTVDLALGVALRVDADALVAFGENAARLAEIDAAGQFPHDHDVETGHHIPLEA